MPTRIPSILAQLSDSDTYRLVKGKDVDITQVDSTLSSLSDDDLFLVDDESAGTQGSTKKITASAMRSYLGVASLGDDVSLYLGDGNDFTIKYSSANDALEFTGLSGLTYSITSDGVFRFPTVDTEPSGFAGGYDGGVYYDGADFYLYV